jgi:integrase
VDGIAIRAAAMDKNTFRESTKTRRIKPQPLHPETVAALKSLPSRGTKGFVFVKNGRPLGRQAVINAWKKAATAAGYNIGCYQGTRHSLASQAINNGVGKDIISKFLGHADSRSTDRYAKLETETLKEV